MTDVFISYSRADKERVAELARAIEGEGYEVWWDEELPPHMSYGDVITDKIENAKAAVVVWSADASKSEWVRAEADAARNHKKLIQTALADIIPPLPFNQIQCADLSDWHGEQDHPGWRKVKQSLVALCGEREGKAAAAVPPVAPEPTPAPVATPPPPPKPTAEPAVTATAQAAPPPQASGSKGHSPALVLGVVGAVVLAGAGLAWTFSGDDKQGDDDTTPVALLDEGGDAAGDDGDGGKPVDPNDPMALVGGNDAAPVQAPPPVASQAPPAQQQAPVPDAYNRDVTLINQAGEVIMYMYWSNTNQDSWGPDQLGSDVWPDGQSANVTIDDGSGACNFDFMAVTASGREIVRPNIDVCSVYEIYFN
jgi:hypothetical protein